MNPLTTSSNGVARLVCESTMAAEEPQIEEYMGVVRGLARSLRARLRTDTVELEELEADGYEALVRAVNAYDATKGPLLPYVLVRCRGAMIDGLRRRMLSTRGQRANGFEEPAVISLEQELSNDLQLAGIVADANATTAEDVIERVSSAAACSELAALPRPYRRILFWRFLEGRSQEDVAKSEGVSRRFIAHCELRIRRRLRDLDDSSEEQPLTAKELKVLRLAAEGASSAETAKRLRKGRETVKSQRRTIIAKLQARNIINAVAIGYRSGLLD
jgi:RNA polymerase sigma factor (sigma-70 family)